MDQVTGTIVFAGAAVGLLILLRRLSRPVDAAALEPGQAAIDPEPEGEPPAQSLRVRSHYFRSFDSEAGPPDPDCFHDEVFLELENSESGDAWTSSYFVGTPSGIAQLMKDEGWDEMFGTDLLIVRRFDRELILQSLLDRINEQYEITPEPPRDRYLG